MTIDAPSSRAQPAGAEAGEAWAMLSGFLQAARVVPETQRAAPGSLPLTVIGGFLGAGKTTLLNRLLGEPHGRRIAVLVNDFGRVNIDAALVRSRTADAIELSNGCACCSLAGDLARTLVQIAQRQELPDAVVIEASGLADPRGIVQIALANPALRLDGIVALADAESLLARAGDPACAPTLLGQLDVADVVVLNKRDLVDDASAAAARTWLEARMPGQPVIEARHGGVPVEVVLGIHSDRELPVQRFTGDHAAAFESLSVTLAAPLHRTRLRALLHELPPSVVRAKGILRVADDPSRRTVYQRVGARWSLVPEGDWANEPPMSRIVLIARRDTLEKDEFTRRLNACVTS